ncbi:hypothetical protein [Bordetella muralis]|jgi:hypothetical protein|uniref:hypothetical protein n=1 Tax=Bordetella muralis TaxID=1649130 RepID=UPI0039F086BF
MAKKLDDVIASLPTQRRAKIEQRAQELASPKDLRQAVENGPCFCDTAGHAAP